MQNENTVIIKLIGMSKWLIVLVVGLMVSTGYLFLSKSNNKEKTIVVEKVVTKAATSPQKKDFLAGNFDVSGLGNSMHNEMIKYGHDLIVNTADHIGPDQGSMAFAGNRLSCGNCHLDAGTKAFAAPYIGVTGRFPQYRGRENKVGSIEERINGCMQRSMNGKSLPENGKEMRAMVAYMNWISKGVPAGEKIDGRGFKAISIPERKVDLENGKNVFIAQCTSCHGEDGLGTRASNGTYTFPPLAGADSYNHGAGMHRVLTAAQFIKYNMPLGATAENPILTDADSYDVAGYINSLKRPLKKNTKKDFPQLERKPVSTPYGPWADHFSAEQHKNGPFQEIIAFYKKEYNITKTK